MELANRTDQSQASQTSQGREAYAHKVPESIQWHEGMLLAPQHFQELARRQEQLLHYHSAFFAPFHWGVHRSIIDPEALLAGCLRVSELEAVLPDGLIVALAKNAHLELDLNPRMDELRRGTLEIHLAVPVGRPGRCAVPGELARYESIDGRLVTDANTGEGELRIPRLRPRAHLRFADQLGSDFVSMPLARVGFSDDKLALRRDYVPPLLRVTGESEIGRICASIIACLWEKADYLSKVKMPSVRATPQLLATKIGVQSMMAGLPPFQALLRTGVAHPFALYLALCSIAGALAVLRSEELAPPELRPYDHNDLYATFEAARRSISQLLDEYVVVSYLDDLFRFEKNHFWLLFQKSWKGRTLLLGVRGEPGIPEAQVAEWVEQSLIGSRSEIQGLRDRRILGAERRRSRGEHLVPARGVLLYILDGDSEHIKVDEPLVVFNPRTVPRPLEIILYVENLPDHPVAVPAGTTGNHAT